MQHLSTAFLIIALVIAVNQGGATAQDDSQPDQIADETKNRAVTIIDGPKYVEPPTQPTKSPTNQTQDQRPPSKPPHPAPDKPHPDKNIQNVLEHTFQPYRGPIRQSSPPSRHVYPKPLRLRHRPNSLYRVVPLSHHRNYQYAKPSTHPPLAFAASSGRPVRVPLQPPKFSVPIETINGIRTDVVRPPKGLYNTTTTTSTTTTTTTTQRPLRNKRIWPKNYQKKNLIHNNTASNTTDNSNSTSTNSTDLDIASATHFRFRYVDTNRTAHATTTFVPLTITRGYRRVTRVPNHTTTTAAYDTNNTRIAPNDWVPIIPSHYPNSNNKRRRPTQTKASALYSRRSDAGDIEFTGPEENPDESKLTVRVPNHTTTTAAYDTNNTSIAPTIILSHYPNPNNESRRPAQTKASASFSRRSDAGDIEFTGPEENPHESKRTVYLQSYGIVPVAGPRPALASGRKKMVLFRKKKRPLNMHVYSGYSPKHSVPPHAPYALGDLNPDASQHPHVITRIKHHHHHHHHRYIKTVEKPVKVPYKVEVPKPYPVPVEKKVPVAVEKIKIVEKPVPYPVQVEKRIPYPIQVQVPHPVPYKVIEKEYIPKPYPVYHHVPVLKHVEVKVPQPVPVHVEKRVPYPVEVQVPVPVYHPYPVNVTIEKKVPYPVPVRVLVPQPYPVETRVPYPVEVKVREPVEVVKHVPVRVPVPQPYPVRVPTPVAVPVEKKVPYPVEVEKKVPVPYKVIVPQKVEVEKKVPVYVPRPYPVEKKVPVTYPVPSKGYNDVPSIPIYINQPYQFYDQSYGGGVTVSGEVTSTPHHTVTVHGNTGFAGFQSRSDKTETTSAESSESTEASATTAKQDVTMTSVTHRNTGFAGFQRFSDNTEMSSTESSESTEASATAPKQDVTVTSATTNATTQAG